MGNVNGREDGVGSLSGVDEEGGGVGGDGAVGGVAQDNMGAVHDEAHVSSYPARPPPPLPEAMGQSPPPSPRATQSPLMFTPQVPVAPLQRPDEMHVSSHSWMQTSSGYDEMSGEEGIPTMITWCYGGKEVSVEGSWDNWRT
ncbi:hypothetical protein CRG98_018841, partial [Punica granatum]